MPRILIINPNSNERVTDNLRESLEGYRAAASIDCVTLSDGPFGIESDQDVEKASGLVVARTCGETNYDAFVIACYSDPGLQDCRKRIAIPVFAMQESALKAAALGGRRFGVLALSDESIARHLPYIDSLGLRDQLAGELPLDISVEQSAADPATLDKVINAGRRLIDEFGAGALVLGCAGMAAIRESAESALTVPVIEPVRAAVEDAISATSA
jgi:allantoin racemase